MANIKNHLNNIKNALFGQEVRGSIHDGIDAINKEVESTTGRQVDLEKTFDQLVINAGNSNAEIVDARVKSDGTSYSKLGDRLNEVDSQLEHIVTEANEQFNTINNKVRYVSVLEFGAKGDGVTDDTLAFKLAISQTDVDEIYVPNGTYIIKEMLTLRENVTLFGEGEIKQPIENNDFHILKTTKNNTLKGLTIAGSIEDDSYVDIDKHAIYLVGDNITVENCIIKGKSNAIFGDTVYGNNVTIKNNDIRFTKRGIYLTHPRELGLPNRKKNIVVEGNRVEIQAGFNSKNADTHIRGIVIWNANAPRVINNTILGSQLSFESRYTNDLNFSNNTCDVFVSIVGDNTTCDNNIVDLTLRPSVSSPLPIGNSSGIEYVGNNQRISNNFIRGFAKNGLVCNNILGTTHNILLSNNMITACGYGIWTRGNCDITITNNKIEGATNCSIYCDSQSDFVGSNIKILNNTISNDNSSNSNNGGSIWIYGNRDLYISGNVVESNTTNCLTIGLSKYNVTNAIITNNTFRTKYRSAIYLGSIVQDIVITNNFLNSLEGNSIRGVYKVDTQAKINNNVGYISTGKLPVRGTWEVGERIQIYDSTNINKTILMCTKSGTGSDNIDSSNLYVSSTLDSDIITFNSTTARYINQGQYISLSGAFEDAKIIDVTLNYDTEGTFNQGYGALLGGIAKINKTATGSVSGELTYVAPTFQLL